ncbi:MAG TPA: CRTAC1 family protein [Acidobacteriota bacterium]
MRKINAECGMRNAEYIQLKFLKPRSRSISIPHSAFRIPHSRTAFGLALSLWFLPLISTPAPTTSHTPFFRDATIETGLKFHHFTGAAGEFYLPEIMGGGAALLDYDNDGDLDVYFVQGAMLDRSVAPLKAIFPPAAGQPPGGRLFRNELIPSGKLKFSDVTSSAGIKAQFYGMGAAVGDYDNDGNPDLYLTGFGPNLLYRNNGNGTFSDVTAAAGVGDPRWSTSAAFLDFDGDGDLDLYVANYVDFTVKGNKKCSTPGGVPDYCTPAAYNAVPDRLYRNDGHGRFTDVSASSGIGKTAGPGLGVAAADFNGDHRADIFVANDGAANLLWINRGDGTFEESALISGVAYAEDGVTRAGMGVACGDFDNDGDEDILVSNLRREGCSLFVNSGSGVFSDETARRGLLQPTFLFTGFGAGWIDSDNDGNLDLFIANGAVTFLEALSGNRYPFHQKNLLLQQRAGGRFLDVSQQSGPALQLSDVSRGAAFGDIDNDGDIDIVIANNNGPARLLLNESTPRMHWVRLRLEGVRCNRSAIGAHVYVMRKGQPPLHRRVHSDGSYCSASDLRVHVGLGARSEIDAVRVQWPDGSSEIWNDIRSDSEVRLRQFSGKPVK